MHARVSFNSSLKDTGLYCPLASMAPPLSFNSSLKDTDSRRNYLSGNRGFQFLIKGYLQGAIAEEFHQNPFNSSLKDTKITNTGDAYQVFYFQFLIKGY